MDASYTILVTGGAGFIGANLIRHLIDDQHIQIHLLVENATDLWRLDGIIHKLVIHTIDLTSYNQIRQLVHAIKPSIIYHLASFGGMPHQQNPKTIYDVNFYGTMNLLSSCKEIGFECFINTGSSSEYGIKNEIMHENLVLEPVSDYGVAKAAATQYCLKEALGYALPIYTVRPFAVYGDYEMPTRLIPTVITSALQGKPIGLSAGHYVRDFIYIKDMIAMYMAITQQKPRSHYIFNAGTGTQTRISDVVSCVSKLLRKSLCPQWAASIPRPWEPKTWQADITLARTVLNWQPAYNLEQGLAQTIAWLEKNITLYHKGDTPHVSPHGQSSSLS